MSVAKQRVRISSEVLAQRVEDGMVLIHLKSNSIFELNGTAARLWELLGETATVSEVLARLEEEYDVSPEELEEDVSSTLDELAHNRFLNIERQG